MKLELPTQVLASSGGVEEEEEEKEEVAISLPVDRSLSVAPFLSPPVTALSLQLCALMCLFLNYQRQNGVHALQSRRFTPKTTRGCASFVSCDALNRGD